MPKIGGIGAGNFLEEVNVYIATPEDAGNPPDGTYFLLVNPEKLKPEKTA